MKIPRFVYKSSPLVLIGLLAGIGGVAAYHYQNSMGVPQGIKRDANFTIYYPKSRAGLWRVDTASVRLDADKQLLTLNLASEAGRVSVTEQPSPDAFGDIPNYYEKLLEKLQQYDQVVTTVGTVTLTRPVELGGGQSAVVNTNHGTLMFAHPDHDLSRQAWTGLFNSLRAVQ